MAGAINVDIVPKPGVDVVADATRLPFADGVFDEVHAINPHRYDPVNPETARVLKPGGILKVSGQPQNPMARPRSTSRARAAGFVVTGTGPIDAAHLFGVQQKADGTNLNPTFSRSTTYEKLL